MEEKKDILNQLKKSAKPELNADFFDQFPSKMMSLISDDSEANKEDLELKKTNKPEVPTGFFDQFSDKLMQKIQEEETEKEVSSPILDQLILSAKPAVPKDYFENFQPQTTEKESTPKKGRIIQLRYLAAAASVAAVIALFFYLLPGDETNDETQYSSAETQEEISEETYDIYLAYMDEEDIVEYIIENDIELEGESDELDEEELFDSWGNDFEEFYLEM